MDSIASFGEFFDLKLKILLFFFCVFVERNRDMAAVKGDLAVLRDATRDVAGLVVDQVNSCFLAFTGNN